MNQLKEDDFTTAKDPFLLFDDWFSQAKLSELNDPEAMALATTDSRGMPNVRMVLLKGWSAEGFVFYTNQQSAKGGELSSHPKAAALFHWKSLRRQIRIRGNVVPVSAQEADDYFASRPRASQIGAWASQQSRPLDSRAELEGAVAEYEAKFNHGTVPRPPHWSGWRIVPVSIEFWHDRRSRLHDRIVFSRVDAPSSTWTSQRLFP